MPTDEETHRDVMLLNEAVFGKRDDPNDFGMKSDISVIKATLKELTDLVRRIAYLAMGLLVTALLALIIKINP